jgi:tyrosine-protein phosphatase SIW14
MGINVFPSFRRSEASNLIMGQLRLLPLTLLLISVVPQVHAQDTSQPITPSVMSSAYGEKLKIHGVPNPGKINDGLYRGAQPNEQGLEELKKLGITTIVDLRAEDRGKSEWERQQAEKLGMRFVHIPIAGFAAPTNEEVAQFLSLFRDSQQKVFVHCLLGEDRTGVFVATYRMSVQKWPVAQAMREMNTFGFNSFWHPAMKAFVRDFPARLTSAPAFASLQDGKPPAQIVSGAKSN